MAHTIEDLDHHWSGDTLILAFVVWDGDADNDQRKDISNASIDWWLTRNNEVVLSVDDSSVTPTITDAANGEFEIQLDRGATDALDDYTYDERLRLIDANDQQVTFGASFSVSDTQR